MRTVRIDHTELAVATAEHHQLPGGRDRREHITSSQVRRSRECVPAVGDGRRLAPALQLVGQVIDLQGHAGSTRGPPIGGHHRGSRRQHRVPDVALTQGRAIAVAHVIGLGYSPGGSGAAAGGVGFRRVGHDLGPPLDPGQRDPPMVSTCAQKASGSSGSSRVISLAVCLVVTSSAVAPPVTGRSEV